MIKLIKNYLRVLINLKVFILINLILIGYGSVFSQTASSKIKNLINEQPIKGACKVTGKVLNIDDLVLLGIDIVFTTEENERKVNTNDFGEYETVLPSKKLIRITMDSKNGNFSYKRSPIKLNCESNKVLTINIYPLPKVVSYGDESPEYKYEVLNDFAQFNENLIPIISYLKNKTQGKIAIYKFATLTLNTMTVSANELIIDKIKKTIQLKGNVWIENGETRKDYNELTLKVKKGELIIITPSRNKC